jgi:glycosyltransferase involved in cell wall biosynthesis
MSLSKISVPVLCYHKVSHNGGITPEKFEEHLKFMKKAGYSHISAKQLIDFMENGTKLPSKPVLLTFDDCFVCNWVYAIPLLEKYDYRGVFFPVTNFVGKGESRPQMGSEKISEIKTAEESFSCAIGGDLSQFFNENELIATYKRGHEIYSHSQSHMMTFRNLKKRGVYPDKCHWGMNYLYGDLKEGDVFYTKASAFAFDGIFPDGNHFRRRSSEERYQFCLQEFKASKQYLENLLDNNDLDLFCWPWGDFDDLSMEALKEAGYKGSFTLERSSNSFAGDPFYINRISISEKSNIKWLKNKLEIYGRKSSADLFFKKFRKKNEITKIMYITDSTKFSSGGIRQLMYNLRGMSEMGFDLTLICREDSEIAHMAQDFADIKFADLAKPFKAGWQISKIIKKVKPHIIHTYHNKGQKGGVIGCALSGHKAKLFVNRGVTDRPGNFLYYVNPFVNGITANSIACAKALASRYIPKKRIHLIHNGINLELFNPMDNNGKVNVVFVGNSNHRKGYDMFEKIIADLPDHLEYKAIAIGLKEKFECNGIESIGIVRNVHDYLKKGDIFLMVSRAKAESFPNTLLEAMASGMATIGFDVAAVGEILIDDHNGYVLPQEDTKAMLEKTIYLLENPQERKRLGENNRKEVMEKYSYQAKCIKLLKLYSGERFNSI